MNIMKITVLLTSLLVFSLGLIAQRTPTKEEKQVVNPIVDRAFENWSISWRLDKYVSKSTKINSIREDEDYGDITVYGEFSYVRLFNTFSGTFEANIVPSEDGGLKVSKIVYRDHEGMRGSKTF